MEYVVFDLETTGLSPERDAIVEIGAIRIRNGEVLEDDTFHTLVNPERDIPWYVSRVHGIRNAHVASAPRITEALPAFLQYAGTTPVVAHNAAFDTGFIRAAAARQGLEWRPQREICTLQLSRRAFPREKSHKLDALAQRLGLLQEARGLHSAHADARLTAHAFAHLLRHLGEHA
ncbi:3'-5' exonuclease [Deinococcus maricopensis]|uniref:DNA polymerase III, epsilon subunit n=1 Tax=Deinococcus maricopensis (strain DSM 21211 / LMG 22137 / NRRL B-23946 / LB-34) TaxID=709986 RepID=E8U405_DEIML|nr:3'-5' exonuclease [Deinococcus maricopensis]ADV65699.1 DNA polymerase III, epsilon subunit [Deinococcus maricopensis DSM 21211]